ncbi:MAG TPA: phosphodiester glycosidase family protein [Niastella sp.]
MNLKTLITLSFVLLTGSANMRFVTNRQDSDVFVSYKVDVSKADLRLYWKNDNGQQFNSIASLKTWVESKNKKLVFAMNGGMYMEDRAPLGLYIENSKQLRQLNTAHGSGNFYLQPNGVFYITTDNKAGICKTQDLENNGKIKYATQSGPLLVVNGDINTVFTKGSVNTNIRNGVGILPTGEVVFAMSKSDVNFYDFAQYFQDLGCKYALYLDGFVSRTYLPEKNWIQTDGDFGVIIGVTK